MTVKTTLSFTDRHHRFLTEKVGEGVFASASAAVAAALEQMIEDEVARRQAVDALVEEIRARLATPAADYLDLDDVFTPARNAAGAA
jgi:Arc/MetJ-type ribon-helix-helix transcriptional regulator